MKHTIKTVISLSLLITAILIIKPQILTEVPGVAQHKVTDFYNLLPSFKQLKSLLWRTEIHEGLEPWLNRHKSLGYLIGEEVTEWKKHMEQHIE